MRHPRGLTAAGVALAGSLLAASGTFLLTACDGGDTGHRPASRAQAGLTGEPRGVVVLQGGTLFVLDRLPGLNAKPVAGSDRGAPAAPDAGGAANAAFTRSAAPAPAGGAVGAALTPSAAPAVQPLTDLRQLTARLVAGLRGQTLVALDPRRPGAVRRIAPALAWFPDLAGTGGWAVTEPNQATGPDACPALPHSRAREPRYRLEHRDLTTSAVERAPFLLPCGTLPVADTRAGFVTETVRPRAGTAGAPVLDVRLADHATLRPGRYLARSAAVLDADAGTLLVAATPCGTPPCERLLSAAGPRPTVGPLPGRGRLTGTGSLDATGRYLAAASVPAAGGPPHLVVCDLRTGHVKDLGRYRTAAGPPSDLRADMPSVWSGTRFLFTDPSAGTLTSYDTHGGATQRRTGLDTGGVLQVWGATG